MGALYSKLIGGGDCEDKVCYERKSDASPEVKGIDSVDVQQRETFNRRQGTSGMSGQLYEIQLLMYFLLQGKKLCEKNKMKGFHLATNMKEAGDLDDVVFSCRYVDQNGAEKTKIIFLQAKHRENPLKDKVTLETLLSGENKGDFQLKTYFIAYRKIKEHFQKLKTSPIFGGKFEDCELILFTNSSSTFKESDKNVEKAIINENDILYIDDHNDYSYKVNLHENKAQKIRETLKNSSDCKKLAKQLAECVMSKKCVDVDKGVMRLYHCKLAEEVIERTNANEGKFQEDFLSIENDSSFKQTFLHEIHTREEFAGHSEEDLISQLTATRIILPEKFGTFKDKYMVATLPNDLVYEDEIVDFLSRFKIFVNQLNEKRLSEIVKTNVQAKFAVEDSEIESVFSEIRSKVEKWWKDDNYFLTQDNIFYEESARVEFWFDVKGPVELFTGRQEELLKLHEALQRNQEADRMTVISQSTSISGLGGIGKSELARKYIQLHSKDYNGNIVWLNAENYGTLCESFRRLALNKLRICIENIDGKPRDIQCVVKEVYQFFSNRKCLFVFDNADKCRSEVEGDDSIAQFMPSLSPDAKKPYILITSRNRNWGNIAVLPLTTFTEEEAIEFIRRALNLGEELEETEVKMLAETLQYFPLALQQAVAYIRETNNILQIMGSSFRIRDYIERYKKETEKLLNYKFPDDSLDLYTKTTFTTWRITISKIQENFDYGEKADQILRVIAYLSGTSIPTEIFRTNEHSEDENDELYGSIFNLLQQYSLIEVTDCLVTIHKLLQEVTRIDTRKIGKEVVIMNKAFELLKRNAGCCNDTADGFIKTRLLLPHFETFLTHVDDWIHNNDEDKVKFERMYVEYLLTKIGDMYEIIGNPRRQQELLCRALRIQETYLEPEHVNIASTLLSLSIAYGYLGEPETKKKLLFRVLKTLVKHFGWDHFEVAKCLVNLGMAYRNLGKPVMQKTLLEKSLQILEKHFGSYHLEVARCLLNLAIAYGDLREPQKQKEMLERALQIYEKHYGCDHMLVGRCLINLGTAYYFLGEPLEQKKLVERALKIFEKYYGPDHFEVTTCLVNLGNAHGYLGEHVEQKRLYERALQIDENHYGSDHFKVAITLINLANACGDLGEHLEQRKILERALQIYEKHYGSDHFQVASILANLGNVYEDLGESMEGKKIFERALKIAETYYGSDNFRVAEFLVDLGNAHGSLGEPLERKKLFERALYITEKHYGSDHFQVAKYLVKLGNAHGALGDSLEKKKLLERALYITENHYGSDHFQVAKYLVKLGDSHGFLGEHLEKKKLLERALQIKEIHYGCDHIEIAIALLNLGNVCGDIGESLEKKKLLERSLQIQEKHYAANNYEDAITLLNLANTYGGLGDLPKQKELLERALYIIEKHYGSDHFQVAKYLVNLGNAHGALGNHVEERILLERALQIKENHYGCDHIEIAITLLDLGNVCGHLGIPQEQNKFYERSLQIQEKLYAADQYEDAITLLNLSNIYGALGEPMKQKKLLERALCITENYYGSDHCQVAKYLVNLGNAHGALGEHLKKKELLERALNITENYYGSDHCQVAKYREMLVTPSEI